MSFLKNLSAFLVIVNIIGIFLSPDSYMIFVVFGMLNTFNFILACQMENATRQMESDFEARKKQAKKKKDLYPKD